MIIALLLAVSALPLIIAYILFRRAGFLTTPVFLFSLLCGVLSVIIAAVVQGALPAPDLYGKAQEFFYFFVRIALLEEGARFVMLTLLFIFVGRFFRITLTPSYTAALGLVSGLAFASLETAFFSAANSYITIIRLFTAAPLHGACAARAGQAAFFLKREPLRAAQRFLGAAALHGFYNFMVARGPLFTVLAAVLAVTSLFAVIRNIRHPV
ncbi:hypothetical protein AGMMS50212_07760 [Spirochaetia bacterium]|nr:hypothetical protein AGMMS50212_07760 [Spirochaetia bacterium]